MGCTKMILNNDELASFYEGTLDIPKKENEYILLENDGKIIDKYCFQDEKLRKLKYKQLDNNYTGLVKPRNPLQECAMDMLQDRRSTVKLITGCFGSGLLI